MTVLDCISEILNFIYDRIKTALQKFWIKLDYLKWNSVLKILSKTAVLKIWHKLQWLSSELISNLSERKLGIQRKNKVLSFIAALKTCLWNCAAKIGI